MSRKLIPTGKLNGEHIALRTKGDGNCLFRAASILAFGDESKHLEMRVRTLLELACNKLRYLNDPNNKQRIHAEERYILRKSSRKRRDECSEELDTLNLEVYFKQVVRETCKESNSAVVWHLLALPTVFWRSVKIVFPEVTEDIRELQECFKDAIDPCGGRSMLDPLVIMWTSIKPLEEMKLNHFVPLVPAGEVHSLGKGKLKIFLIVFTKCLFFCSRRKHLFGNSFLIFTERNTTAKQNGSKQPSEQDERRNRDSNTQTEPRNRDPPPQSAMDQRQNKKKLSLSKKDNGKFYYCNSDPCLSPGTKEGKLTVAGARFSKVLVT
ncbi:uncharacterized protein LOC113683155 [Pocillopora damicornis]|uniref:uncharacterized protein LOC113683155 n=1 Tax=Pocillopora damicornis TaxID=46731 RepID=UPI000F558511|nr:uncharacterized protein LOC113683155 [Pocillopora damicornis]